MPLPTNLENIAARAIAKWGNHSQEMVALGELGELITLFGRRAQRRDTPEEWIDEIADGFIMLTQLAHIHGTEAVNLRLDQKLKKLSERIGSV